MNKFSSYVPRYIFCALGEWDNFNQLREFINQAGFVFDEEYSCLNSNPDMGESFAISVDRVNYSFSDDDWEAVENHKAVAYFLSPENVTDEFLKTIGGKALTLVKYLFENLGVTAFKCETSGIAHGRDQWIKMSEEYDANTSNTMLLYEAFVRRPLSNDYGFNSCGMQLLGLQDVLYSQADNDESELQLVKNMDKIAEIIIEQAGDYDVIESQIEDLDIANKNVALFPCNLYDENDIFFYNPYGYVYVGNEEEDFEDEND